jgi:hypothetical protein
MKHVAANLALWLIAIVVTFLLVPDAHVMTTLAPVYAVCMIGSVVTVRAATRRAA